MKDLNKFRIIADFLLQGNNYNKAFDTYHKVYNDCWITIGKIFSEINKTYDAERDASLQNVFVVNITNSIIFKDYRLNTEKFLKEFAVSIIGRIKCLLYSDSIKEKNGADLVINDFLALFLMFNYSHDTRWIVYLKKIFNPVIQQSSLVGIKLNWDKDKIIKELFLQAKKNNQTEWNFLVKLFIKCFSAETAASLEFRQSIMQLLKKTDNPAKWNRTFFNDEFKNLDSFPKMFQPLNYSEKELGIHYGFVLGLEGQVKKSEIREKYLKKISLFHPDKFKNEDAEFNKLLEDKAKEINEAYEWFKKKYGLQ